MVPLQHIYGEPLLKYMMNLSEGEMLPESLPPELDGFLRNVHAQIVSGMGRNAVEIPLLATTLCQYEQQTGMSLVNFWRTRYGGVMAAIPPSDDLVLQAVRKIAHELWPAFLIADVSNAQPARDPSFWRGSAIGMGFAYPAMKTACLEFMRDAELSTLFPDAQAPEDAETGEYMGISSMWYFDSGHAGSQQLTGIIGGLIADSIARSIIYTGRLDHNGVMDSLADSLEALRKLARNEVVSFPTIVGLYGLQIEEGIVATFESGLIRQPRPLELQLLMTGDTMPSAILETQYPIQLLAVENTMPDPENFGAAYGRYADRYGKTEITFQGVLNKIKWSLLLSSPENSDDFIGARENSRFTTMPIQNGAPIFWFHAPPVASVGILDRAAAESAMEWYRIVQEKHPDSLNITMTRLLNAAAARQDANDAFIDALIAWENMFGTSTETVFRVTGAIAKLLENDPTEKATLQKLLKDLYGTRSKLVHGAVPKETPEELLEKKNKSMHIALQCVKKLYKERADLLQKKSEDRSRIILLE